MTPVEIASEVHRLSIGGFVNAYLVGNARRWVLVDTGIAGQFEYIKDAAEQMYGVGTRPSALILTHGHGDHAGSALALATYWDVPIYAHPMELPFLDGRSDYPPADPTTGGPFAFLLRFVPNITHGLDLGGVVEPLPENGSVPGLSEEWRWVGTPGHAPGQVALWREQDRVLIAGDAVATVEAETIRGLLRRQAAVTGPPTALTPDWYETRKSIEILAALKPKVILPGHGEPVLGASATVQMQRLADFFRVPQAGRYVTEPAEFDEQGVRYLPPPAKDPLPVRAGIAVAVMVVGIGIWSAVQRKKNNG